MEPEIFWQSRSQMQQYSVPISARPCRKLGTLHSQAKDASVASPYEKYYDYEEPVRRVAGHRVLALNRGEKEKILGLYRSSGGADSALSGEEDHPEYESIHDTGIKELSRIAIIV